MKPSARHNDAPGRKSRIRRSVGLLVVLCHHSGLALEPVAISMSTFNVACWDRGSSVEAITWDLLRVACYGGSVEEARLRAAAAPCPPRQCLASTVHVRTGSHIALSLELSAGNAHWSDGSASETVRRISLSFTFTGPQQDLESECIAAETLPFHASLREQADATWSFLCER